jgi:uncharacterized LabA/DUF88 family protein
MAHPPSVQIAAGETAITLGPKPAKELFALAVPNGCVWSTFLKIEGIVMNTFQRLAIFIDGSSLYHAARSLNFDIDYKRLLDTCSVDASLVRAYYYSVETDEFHSTRPLIDWLDYNGYSVTTKLAKEYNDGDGRRKVKRNISVDLTVNAIEVAERVDRMLLFTGDGDFRALVEAVQRRGVHVTVASTLRSKQPMVSDDLRRQADTFVDLEDLKHSICRNTQAL